MIAGVGAGQAIAHQYPRALGAAGLIASANAPSDSTQCYLATFFTAAIWLGSWLLWGTRHCFPATHRAS